MRADPPSDEELARFAALRPTDPAANELGEAATRVLARCRLREMGGLPEERGERPPHKRWLASAAMSAVVAASVLLSVRGAWRAPVHVASDSEDVATLADPQALALEAALAGDPLARSQLLADGRKARTLLLQRLPALLRRLPTLVAELSAPHADESPVLEWARLRGKLPAGLDASEARAIARVLVDVQTESAAAALAGLLLGRGGMRGRDAACSALDGPAPSSAGVRRALVARADAGWRDDVVAGLLLAAEGGSRGATVCVPWIARNTRALDRWLALAHGEAVVQSLPAAFSIDSSGWRQGLLARARWGRSPTALAWVAAAPWPEAGVVLQEVALEAVDADMRAVACAGLLRLEGVEGALALAALVLAGGRSDEALAKWAGERLPAAAAGHEAELARAVGRRSAHAPAALAALATTGGEGVVWLRSLALHGADPARAAGALGTSAAPEASMALGDIVTHGGSAVPAAAAALAARVGVFAGAEDAVWDVLARSGARSMAQALQSMPTPASNALLLRAAADGRRSRAVAPFTTALVRAANRAAPREVEPAVAPAPSAPSESRAPPRRLPAF